MPPSKGTLVGQPGLAEVFTIDGVDLPLPKAGGYVVDNPPQQTAFQSMAGGNTLSQPYRGAGMPDRCDLITLTIPYDIDATNASLAEQVEVLRATAGPHEFADWKQRVYVYKLRAGQQYAYLPRGDAFAKWGGASAAEMAVDGTPVATIAYKTTVAEGDAVPAGEVWISETLIRHPFSGLYVAPFKLGTAPGAGAKLAVKYFPVFRVDVAAVPSSFPFVGREDKTLHLIEIN